MDRNVRIWVAGARTIGGAAILRALSRQGYLNVLAPAMEPNLTDAAHVDQFLQKERPELVFLVAGKSGGIGANQRQPAELMLDNLLVECHVIHSAHRCRVKKLLYAASSCIYSRHCAQPMRVESLMTGPLEPTNEAYATAKIAGLKLCQSYRQQFGDHFISVIPANIFGPEDEFHPDDAHVIAALIRKIHEAKERRLAGVEIWGTGNPRREFIFADDFADACVFVMREYDSFEPINLGSGVGMSVRELATLVKDVVGFGGELRFDSSKADGMPSKVLNCGKLRGMGWRPKTEFRSALEETYRWFLEYQAHGCVVRV